MQSSGLLDALPLGGLFLAILALVLFSVEGGYRLGRFRRDRTEDEKEAPVGAMVGATLGLLAFMLAFTFGMAAERFEKRRQVLLDEANALGTTWLRAGMLPERREAIRALLREYVDTRLSAMASGRVTEGIRRSEQIQDQLWAQAVPLAEKYPGSIVVGLFIQSLNEVIDLHAIRVTAGIRNRIPGPIWLSLFAVAALSFAGMGYHAGLSRTSRSMAEIAVALTFTLVIGLIADLDRPSEGILRVSQQALIDVQKTMQATPPADTQGGPVMNLEGIQAFATRYTEAWCSQDPSRVAGFFAEDGTLTINGGTPSVGRRAIAGAAHGFMAAFPDLVVRMDGVDQRGAGYVYRWTLTGTNTGPGGTGRHVRINGYEEWTLGADGLVARSLGHFDEVDYKRQLAVR
jgi:uncharacterized protein (TIGR02246 family)